jgi:hypothetical protein
VIENLLEKGAKDAALPSSTDLRAGHSGAGAGQKGGKPYEPTNDLFAVFEDNRETGYLYLYNSKEQRVVEHLLIYDRSEEVNVVVRDVWVATPGPPGTLTIASATRLTAQEISAGTRYASKTGTALIESPHVAEEFVDAAKKTYDVMQPGASKFWTAANAQNFGKKLVDHLLHDDKVIIDLKDASKAQVKDIKDFVKTLPKEEQKRVDYVK